MFEEFAIKLTTKKKKEPVVRTSQNRRTLSKESQRAGRNLRRYF